VRLTVAICTWNRAGLLARTLERLAGVESPAALWEVLVVDNGSTDDTQRVLDCFASRLPLRRVVEPVLGLSRARNAAVAQASGDYILWTDDDVLVDRGWLRAYEGAIHRWPDAAVFGGPIRAQFEGVPPAWLLSVMSEVATAFAVLNLGETASALDSKWRVPYGANYVTRTREQRQVPYDPALGRQGRAGSVGEEIAVVRAILSRGATGWWVPEAAVSHWVPAERQTVAYLREYFTLVGRAAVPPRRFALARRAETLLRYVRAECIYRVRRLTGDPRRWIGPLVAASRLRGRLAHPADGRPRRSRGTTLRRGPPSEDRAGSPLEPRPR
jgi:glycosyltransferase involved in cell wall biosynthesis